jgi:NAD(P)-dependent dehydrogenase (short-subunit alcohol dehydrogenase family)
MSLLKNKTAIITGAGSGIGESVALLFAEHGARVVLTDVNEDGGNRVLKDVKDKGAEAIFVKADSGSAKDNEMVIAEAQKAFADVHIAINNAGIGGAQAPVGEYPIESWDKVIGVNLSGVFYGMRYQIPAMLKAGGGAIVNVASILGQVGFEQSSAYVAAKHGVVGLTKNAALEYSKSGIRVNAIGPGFIKTPLIDENLPEEQQEQLAGLHAIGRLGKPKEVAELVLWLVSEKASFVCGSYYAVDGGYLAR